MCWPHAPRRLSIVGLATLSSIVFATALIIGKPPARADRAHVTVGGPVMLTAPDGSPTKLDKIAGTLETFGRGGARRQPIFISVEPDRDAPMAELTDRTKVIAVR